MKSGRDEAARGSVPGSSPRPDREHRKPQPTTCYTLVCVKTAVEISEESRKARKDYQDPERFFERTYLTRNLRDLAAQTARRLSGITVETSPVFNMATQFGG